MSFSAESITHTLDKPAASGLATIQPAAPLMTGKSCLDGSVCPGGSEYAA